MHALLTLKQQFPGYALALDMTAKEIQVAAKVGITTYSNCVLSFLLEYFFLNWQMLSW